MTGYSHSFAGKWGRLLPGNNMGNYSDILFAVHRLCYNCGPQEGGSWWAGPTSHWVCRWSQYPSRWSLLRGFNESSKVIWACIGERELDWPLGLLGWAPHRWWARWVYLWEFLYRQISCPYSQWGRSLLVWLFPRALNFTCFSLTLRVGTFCYYNLFPKKIDPMFVYPCI